MRLIHILFLAIPICLSSSFVPFNVTKVKKAHPTSIKVLKKHNETFIIGTWTLPANGKTQLVFNNNEPLLVREMSYNFKNINWSAGVGWPTYHTPCPSQGRKHAIVLEFGGQANFTCDMTGHHRGYKVTEVYGYVNDERKEDNTGTFTVVVTFIKQN